MISCSKQSAKDLVESIDPAVYVEVCTARIIGVFRGLPIIYAGNSDWEKAAQRLDEPPIHAGSFGYYHY